MSRRSPSIKLVDLGDGITTAQEEWLDELTKPTKAETAEREAREYARQLAARTAEVAMLTKHARKIAEHAIRLQEAQARAQEEVKEASRKFERQFEALTQEWLSETKFLSDPVKKILHPAHLKIIAMGKEILPLVLREVEKMSGHWFVILNAISPENPVKPEDETSIEKVANAWLKWGKEKGLI